MADYESSHLANLLRQATKGAVSIVRLSRESWVEVYAGNVEFMIGNWRVTFFNDCGGLDYVDVAVAPNGQRFTFQMLADERAEPINQALTREECRILEALLGTSRPIGAECNDPSG
jgi:hypothetical protein